MCWNKSTETPPRPKTTGALPLPLRQPAQENPQSPPPTHPSPRLDGPEPTQCQSSLQCSVLGAEGATPVGENQRDPVREADPGDVEVCQMNEI